MQLALVNHTVLVSMKKLNWILDGEDVIRLFLIDTVNHSCESRRLPGAGRPGDQNNPVAEADYVAQFGRQVQGMKIRNLAGNYAHDNGAGAALHEHIHAKTADAGQAIRDVAGAMFFQIFSGVLVGTDEMVGDQANFFGAEWTDCSGRG